MAKLAVILHHPRNTLNIGAVARAMSNFGASDLRLVAPFHKDYVDAPSAPGPARAILAGAREFATLQEALDDCGLAVGTTGAHGRAWAEPPVLLGQAAPALRAHLAAGTQVGLVFGSEKTGLSNDELSLCHLSLRIPSRDEQPSMNLGQAAAVCLYALLGPDVGPGAAEPAPATFADLLRLDTLLYQVLAAAEFPGIATPHKQRQLRALARRLQLSATDAPHWIGLLRHILWKLQT